MSKCKGMVVVTYGYGDDFVVSAADAAKLLEILANATPVKAAGRYGEFLYLNHEGERPLAVAKVKTVYTHKSDAERAWVIAKPDEAREVAERIAKEEAEAEAARKSGKEEVPF
jgi:hypothetical protein